MLQIQRTVLYHYVVRGGMFVRIDIAHPSCRRQWAVRPDDRMS